MRKIDAVLLSALIIYDYSAQSLVDGDASALQQAFMSENTVQDTKLADSYFSENLFTEGEDNTVRSVKRINSPADPVSEENTISYHELAKINSVNTDNTDVTSINSDIPEAVVNVAENEAVAETVIETLNVPIPEVTAETIEAGIPGATVETVEAATATLNTEMATTEVNTVAYNIETVNTNTQAAATDLTSLDTDEDGVFDYEDKCQGISGVARFEGCPVPDSDADGVNDEEDRCPADIGTTENGGCPTALQEIPTATDVTVTPINSEIKKQEKGFNRFTSMVSFGFNGAVLSNEDFNIVLQFADVLIRQHELKVEVSAVKDNTNINYLVNYLRELGVGNSQVIVSEKDSDGEMDRSKVYMQLKL